MTFRSLVRCSKISYRRLVAARTIVRFMISDLHVNTLHKETVQDISSESGHRESPKNIVEY